MTPTYTSSVDLPAVYQGDSQDPFNVRVRNQSTGNLIYPDSVTCTVSDLDGTYINTIYCENAAGNVSVYGLTAVQTAQMRPGFYRYFLTYIFQDNSVKSYVSGQFEIIQKPIEDIPITPA